MKRLLPLFFFVTTVVVPQNASQKPILELKNQIRIEESNQNKIVFMGEKKKKSPLLAVTYSLLLPGMGELYGGDYGLGKYLTIADAVFWGAFTGFSIYGNNQQDNYKSFAKSIGSVNTSGKDEEYFADISEYIDIDQHNRSKEKEIRQGVQS